MNTLLDKLNGLVARFEEVSTLITDPNVIADQQRYVRLTKEYKELEDLMAARKEYANLLSNLEESTQMSSFSISFCKTSFVSSFEHDVTELNGRPLNSVD